MRKLKRMEQEQKDIWTEKELHHRNNNKTITIGMSKTPRSLRPMEKIFAPTGLEFLGLTLRVMRRFSMWCR